MGFKLTNILIKNYENGRLKMTLKNFLKNHTSLIVIVVAALLVEASSAVMYFASRNIMMETLKVQVEREMDARSQSINARLTKVQAIMDNLAWVVTDDLHEPDSLYRDSYQLVEHNPDIVGSGVLCIPNLYPHLGRLFEPYAARRADGSIEVLQLGSEDHDYTKSAFYTEPIARGKGYWTAPYLDKDGAKAVVTSYMTPVYDADGKIVAVVGADLSLGWIAEVINSQKVYKSTQRFLFTNDFQLLAGEDTILARTIIDKMKAHGNYGYFTKKDKDGGLKHIFYNPIEGNTGYIISSVIDDEDVFGELNRVQIFLLAMIMAGFLLLGFIVWTISRHLERMHKMDEEKQRVGTELRVASQIQFSMLPHNYLKQDDVEIYGTLLPAREVGGDLFDYFIRDGKVYLFVGDVAGKGVPASLYMAITRTLFRDKACRIADGRLPSESNQMAADIMNEINNAIALTNESMMFVTAFVAILDLKTQKLIYCNAGHNAPVIMGSNGTCRLLEVESNIPLGIRNNFIFEQQEIDFPGNTALLLYTDGLTEATSVSSGGRRILFGENRLLADMHECSDSSAIEVVNYLKEHVRLFTEGTVQSDDLTLLFMRNNAAESPADSLSRIVLKNELSEVKRMKDFFCSVCRDNGIGDETFKTLNLAVEEWIANVINYAYPEGTKGSIELAAGVDGGTLTLVISDRGQAFDPTEYAEVDVDAELQDRRIGGLGIHLIRNIMDTMSYKRSDDGYNILTLTKSIN